MKIEAAVLGSPSLMLYCPYGLCERKAILNIKLME